MRKEGGTRGERGREREMERERKREDIYTKLAKLKQLAWHRERYTSNMKKYIRELSSKKAVHEYGHGEEKWMHLCGLCVPGL